MYHFNSVTIVLLLIGIDIVKDLLQAEPDETTSLNDIVINDSESKSESIFNQKKSHLMAERDLALLKVHELFNQKMNLLVAEYAEETPLTECTLCYDAKALVVLKPCLHRVCKSCSEKITVCPWDRQKIKLLN